MNREEHPEGGKRPSPESPDLIFCTECGATLENFCFTSGADDLEAIRRNLARCRRQGRFTGEFCSKLFIAHPEALSGPEEDPGDGPAA